MKEKTLYTCEKCKTDYADRKDAIRCEENHSKKIKIHDMRFLPYSQDKSGFPVTVTLIDQNGNKATYKK